MHALEKEIDRYRQIILHEGLDDFRIKVKDRQLKNKKAALFYFELT